MRMATGYRSRPPAVRVLGALALLLAGCFLGCSRMSVAEKGYQVGLRLMSPSVELTDELREDLIGELGLPPEIRERDAIIEYFLTRAAEASEQYGGTYLLLGEHFLLTDCEKAKGYIRQHLELRKDDEDGHELLAVANEQGCETAIEVARKQGAGPDG